MTTNTQHTPGPWHVGEGNAAQIVYAKDGHPVANATTHHGAYDLDVMEANARLIAAAPELLEALKAIKTVAESDDIEVIEAFYRMTEIARAAIAKAEGRG